MCVHEREIEGIACLIEQGSEGEGRREEKGDGMKEGGRKEERDRGRKGGRVGRREAGREGGREGGREEGRACRVR